MEDKVKEIYIETDYSASGIWIPDPGEGYMVCADRDFLNLPKEILQRLDYWTEWFDKQRPKMGGDHNKMDWDLFRSYGKALAVEMKLFLKDDYKVFFGYANDPECIEIVLKTRTDYGGMIVPVSKRRNPQS